MLGVWFEDRAILVRDDLPRPQSAAGITRVRLLQAGICATDLALLRGYMGFCGVPGHEFVGLALDGPLAGQRVVGDINAGCGTCARCQGGDAHHCSDRTVLGIYRHAGAFAEEFALPTRNLLLVPEGLSDEAAVFAEPLAAAFQILEQVSTQTHRRALVVGDGRLGLLCALVLADAGLEVTLCGRHPERAALMPAGVRWLAPLGSKDPALALHQRARSFDLAVEATGRTESLGALIPLVAPRGTIVLKTTTEAPSTIDLSPLVIDEIALLGSRCGPMAKALDALANHRIDPRPFIRARYPLRSAEVALADAARGGLKVLLEA